MFLLPQQRGDGLVSTGKPRVAIHDEQHQISQRHRDFYLLIDMLSERIGIDKPVAACIDQFDESSVELIGDGEMRSRVTPGMSWTMLILLPTMALRRLLLPTLGRPTIAITGIEDIGSDQEKVNRERSIAVLRDRIARAEEIAVCNRTTARSESESPNTSLVHLRL